jgi:hypothetical protein
MGMSASQAILVPRKDSEYMAFENETGLDDDEKRAEEIYFMFAR